MDTPSVETAKRRGKRLRNPETGEITVIDPKQWDISSDNENQSLQLQTLTSIEYDEHAINKQEIDKQYRKTCNSWVLYETKKNREYLRLLKKCPTWEKACSALRSNLTSMFARDKSCSGNNELSDEVKVFLTEREKLYRKLKEKYLDMDIDNFRSKNWKNLEAAYLMCLENKDDFMGITITSQLTTDVIERFYERRHANGGSLTFPEEKTVEASPRAYPEKDSVSSSASHLIEGENNPESESEVERLYVKRHANKGPLSFPEEKTVEASPKAFPKNYSVSSSASQLIKEEKNPKSEAKIERFDKRPHANGSPLSFPKEKTKEGLLRTFLEEDSLGSFASELIEKKKNPESEPKTVICPTHWIYSHSWTSVSRDSLVMRTLPSNKYDGYAKERESKDENYKKICTNRINRHMEKHVKYIELLKLWPEWSTYSTGNKISFWNSFKYQQRSGNPSSRKLTQNMNDFLSGREKLFREMKEKQLEMEFDSITPKYRDILKLAYCECLRNEVKFMEMTVTSPLCTDVLRRFYQIQETSNEPGPPALDQPPRTDENMNLTTHTRSQEANKRYSDVEKIQETQPNIELTNARTNVENFRNITPTPREQPIFSHVPMTSGYPAMNLNNPLYLAMAASRFQNFVPNLMQITASTYERQKRASLNTPFLLAQPSFYPWPFNNVPMFHPQFAFQNRFEPYAHVPPNQNNVYQASANLPFMQSRFSEVKEKGNESRGYDATRSNRPVEYNRHADVAPNFKKIRTELIDGDYMQTGIHDDQIQAPPNTPFDQNEENIYQNSSHGLEDQLHFTEVKQEHDENGATNQLGSNSMQGYDARISKHQLVPNGDSEASKFKQVKTELIDSDFTQIDDSQIQAPPNTLFDRAESALQPWPFEVKDEPVDSDHQPDPYADIDQYQNSIYQDSNPTLKVKSSLFEVKQEHDEIGAIHLFGSSSTQGHDARSLKRPFSPMTNRDLEDSTFKKVKTEVADSDYPQTGICDSQNQASLGTPSDLTRPSLYPSFIEVKDEPIDNDYPQIDSQAEMRIKPEPVDD